MLSASPKREHILCAGSLQIPTECLCRVSRRPPRRVDRLRLRTLDETRLPVITIHHWAAVVSRCWVKASACRLQVSLYCAVLYQIVLLSICPGRFSTALLASIVVWSPCGDTQGPSFVFEAVDMPCPRPFHFFSHC